MSLKPKVKDASTIQAVAIIVVIVLFLSAVQINAKAAVPPISPYTPPNLID